MKPILPILVFLILSNFTTKAQNKNTGVQEVNWLANWTDFQPNNSRYGEPTGVLMGTITSDTKLKSSIIYLLKGNVYVSNNAVLTIEAGTVILGDIATKGTLIITKGAAIRALGIEVNPIVFSSNRSMKKPGDWGGIILLGDAPINKLGNMAALGLDLDITQTSYGGNNDMSNSGIMKFVRIEYAGATTKSGDHLSGLLLGGVGKMTEFRHVMVSYSGGNSYTIYGGSFLGNRIISYKSMNDDFHFNQGVKAQLVNGLVIRSSYLSGNYGKSRAVAVHNYILSGDTDPKKNSTEVQILNAKIANDSQEIEKDIQLGLIKEAVYVAAGTSLEIRKGLISGFNPAVLIDKDFVMTNENLLNIKIRETYFNSCKGMITSERLKDNAELKIKYESRGFNNNYTALKTNELFSGNSGLNPDYRVSSALYTSSKK